MMDMTAYPEQLRAILADLGKAEDAANTAKSDLLAVRRTMRLLAAEGGGEELAVVALLGVCEERERETRAAVMLFRREYREWGRVLLRRG